MKGDDIEIMLFYSFRYALGRSTYAVHDVCSAIMKYNDHLCTPTKNKIIEEIIEADDADNIGMDIDRQEWLHLVDFLRK